MLISLLGLRTPPDDDLVRTRETNPTGVLESKSLVKLNRRVLTAVASDERFPVALEPGWENDARLDPLRTEAGDAFRRVFPSSPWVWKDPLHCLAFAFWRSALPVQPVVVLVNRNPLEIAASALRAWGREKIYGLALWERYLRQALGQIRGLPVLVTDYGALVSAPLAWCERSDAFFAAAGVPSHPPREVDVLAFVDAGLRHAEFSRADVLNDGDVSEAQRALFAALEQLEGPHDDFVPPDLPEETPTTEALLAERRRAFQIKDELERLLELERASRWGMRVRRSRYLAPARPVYARLQDIRRAVARRPDPPLADPEDPRPPLHVLHIGKTGGTVLKHVLAEHQRVCRYQLLFRGHEVGLAGVPAGERFMFLIRDPLARFVSAFNGRLREDRPRYHYPWRKEEEVAFAIFKTPDQLATALSSGDDAEREQAEQAMHGIGHVNTPYSSWFGDAAHFRTRLADVFFIGLQERLDDDFGLLKRKLGLPPEARLPRDETVAHRTPAGFATELSDVARSNLERWYELDIAFFQLCRELAPRVNAAP